jgi:anti-sigma factor RsiW
MIDTTTPHSTAWSLIPWLVNGSIGDDERALLERHLRECDECRAQYRLECRIRDGMVAEAEDIDDPQPSLQRLFARIDAEDAASTAPMQARDARRTAQPARGWMRLLAAAVIVQAIGLATLGALVLRHPGTVPAATGNATYQTLSLPAAKTPAAAIRFVPSPDMTVGTLHAVLAAAGLHIVESSADSAIYGLALAPETDAVNDAAADERIRRAVTQLAARRDVLLVEPILRPTRAVDR